MSTNKHLSLSSNLYTAVDTPGWVDHQGSRTLTGDKKLWTPSAHQPTWRATPQPQAPKIRTTVEHKKQPLDAKQLHNSRCFDTEPVVPPFITLIGDESPWQRAMHASACWFSPGSAASASTVSCFRPFHYSYGKY